MNMVCLSVVPIVDFCLEHFGIYIDCFSLTNELIEMNFTSNLFLGSLLQYAEVNTEIVFAHGLEDYDSDSVQGQSAAPENEMEGEDAKEENAEIGNYSNVSAGVEPALQSGVPENETKVEDGKEENAEIDSSSNVSAAVEPALESGVPKNETEVEDEKEENAKIDPSSKVPAGVEPALSGSDVKDGDHDADPLVHNIIETALDLVDGYIVKMGRSWSAIENKSLNLSYICISCR